jgi:hypothetical protein
MIHAELIAHQTGRGLRCGRLQPHENRTRR